MSSVKDQIGVISAKDLSCFGSEGHITFISCLAVSEDGGSGSFAIEDNRRSTAEFAIGSELTCRREALREDMITIDGQIAVGSAVDQRLAAIDH